MLRRAWRGVGAWRGFRSSAVAGSGGGGGRPGGRPVLGWKDRRVLDARESNATSDSQGETAFELSDAGSLEDLEKYFDLSTATTIDITDLDVFEEPESVKNHLEQKRADGKNTQQTERKGKRRPKGPRSTVVHSLLFGSHKSEGYMIPSKKAPSKVRFSHKRVFANKKLSNSE